MKYFECGFCHHQIFFDDVECQHCQHPIGYVTESKAMLSFEKTSDLLWKALLSPANQNLSGERFPSVTLHHQYFKPCKNYSVYQVCNWVVPADNPHEYCESCQLTHVLPNLNSEENLLYWRRLEQAKRRFLYLTQQMNLMPRPKRDDSDRYGLRFEFLIPSEDEIVMTGHANGVITLNAIEADVVYRETTRVNMGENYRTLLGHFRHESGHYYLDIMKYLHPELTDEFRSFFGDERRDYVQALDHHYNHGAPPNWQEQFISTYATAHPWEDWAETWAHYLHMMETLETAYYGGLVVIGNGRAIKGMQFTESPIGAQDFENTLQNWITLTFNLNALNRSMGLDDAYPFTLSEPVKNKLRFIHKHVLDKAFGTSQSI